MNYGSSVAVKCLIILRYRRWAQAMRALRLEYSIKYVVLKVLPFPNAIIKVALQHSRSFLITRGDLSLTLDRHRSVPLIESEKFLMMGQCAISYGLIQTVGL